MNLYRVAIVRKDQCGIPESRTPPPPNELASYLADQPSPFEAGEFMVVRPAWRERPVGCEVVVNVHARCPWTISFHVGLRMVGDAGSCPHKISARNLIEQELR